MFKKLVQKHLEKLTRKYFRRHHPKLIVVVGGAGKTTTKTAIATVLSTKYRVQLEESNINDQFAVPLAILGIKYPENIHSIGTWLKVFKAMRIRIKSPTGVDVIIQELGTDHPGEIPHFATYLKPDIAVVTSVVPEHMEFFKTMDAVAQEELSVAGFSNLTVINRDDVPQEFAKYADTTNITTYGLTAESEYHFDTIAGAPLDGYTGNFISPEFDPMQVSIRLVGEHNLKAGVAAGLIGAKMGMNALEISTGLAQITPVSGRMRILPGYRGTTLIDDTYNSSPAAAVEALRTLYQIDAPQHIAILGSMNELGGMSAKAHTEVGEMCDPGLLDWVVTIGADAARYLAPAARARGCQVESFVSPLDAGAFVNKVMQPGAIILAKGSQNGVFAEESVKMLLAHIDDEKKLVRQSPKWVATKNAQFESKYYSEVPSVNKAKNKE